ncbi:heterokaryon incompatibility protein [Dactylonectria macrodidyma]|uniref:Heterokaryon incompatibility protein n=1 Tax=Dactylonectria macrodidyma TaxID=307937 RepID=A0A9P9FTJ1_9HYPO|nr:heterokaryon incompatibility protein [Dactylonectria macrodidyma]
MASSLLATLSRRLPSARGSKMSRFTYDCSPLPSPSTFIRLIDLYPSSTDFTSAMGPTHLPPPLRCHIYSVPLMSLPPYTALSYTWGPPDRTHHLELSSHEFFITPSLATCLQHIRHADRTITLWIDQMCINQDDAREKNEQVPLMGQIYRQAKEVLVWVGPSAEGSDSLMDVWNWVGGKAQAWGLDNYLTKERFPEYQQIITKADPTDLKTMEFHNMCQTYGPFFDLKAMHAWYKRPWFSRVWVVQELCLGSRSAFVCGNKRTPVDLVMLALQIFHFYVAYTHISPERMQDMRAVLAEDPTAALFAARKRRRKFECDGGTGDTFFKLLNRVYVGNKVMQATDPRDRIFGLAALATDTQKLVIKPDYGATTVEKIYTRTARAIIQDGELDLLCLSQYPKKLGSLPSWVPDWSGNIQPSFCSLGPDPTELPLFDASRSEQPSLIHTHDESILGVEGYLVDEIEQVCGPWTYPAEGQNFDHVLYLTYFSQIRSLCMISAARNNKIYKTPRRRAEGFWRIPVGDVERLSTHDLCRATSSSFKGYQKLSHDCEAYEQVKALSTLAEAEALFQQGQEDEDACTRYRARVAEMRNKRPYLSKEGYVGMGPVTTASGDVIAVLVGARVPFVLRPKGAGRFSFLGEAYCDGIMDGEITEARSKQDEVLQ